MRKLVILCFTLIVLTSCIGIDSRLTIRDNGSGTLDLTYRVSQMVANLGVSSAGRSIVPLPVNREDFERSLAASKGRVRLSKFDRSENEKDIAIAAQLSFDSVDALAQIDAFKDAGITWSAENGQHAFSEVVSRAPRQPLSEDSVRMLDALFDGYELSFSVQAPRAIADAAVGTLSPDRRTLTYKTSIKDALTTSKDLVMSARW